ncbi:MAG: hypothetical protein ACRES3_08420 [Steroidobacteraceae bacterium]
MRCWIAAALAWALGAAMVPVAADEPTTAQTRRADLAVLRNDYVQKSRAFSPDARRAALDHIASLDARAGELTPAEFLIGVARTAALADNGHDAWHPDEGAWLPETRAPMRFFWFPDALVVARAAKQHEDLLGARVTAIDGHAAVELFERLRPLVGGPDNYRRWNLSLFLDRAKLLHALGLTASPRELNLSLVLRNGTETTRRIEMVPSDSVPPVASVARLLSRPPNDNEPLYLQQPDQFFRIVDLPAFDTLYLQLRSHVDTDDEPIEEFMRAARARLAESKPEHLIVDLRFDGGGNIDPTVAFFNGLAAALPGRIYVIVSRQTFSAGMVAAALVKQSAGDRALIVGEPVGDRLRFWSEGATVCLPNSKYCLQATDGLWDLERGCAQEPGCYGDAYDVKVPTLAPDLAAPLTAEAWLAQTDPAMAAIEVHLWSCKSCRPEPDDVD